MILLPLNSNLVNKTTGFKGVLTATEINDASINVSYTGDISPATADELGLAYGWWAIAHMAHVSSDGYCAQVVYPYTAADVPRYRNCYAGTWSEWRAIGDGWIDLTHQCTFYVTLQSVAAFSSWIKYNPGTRELKGVIETTSDIKNQQIIVDFPAQLPGLGGINTSVGICGVAVNGMNNTDPYLRIMPRVQGGAIISSHTRDEIVHGATYMISFIAQC